MQANDESSLDENLVFIDFEYCAYNYRGFDIANHFCEWAYDYSYPEYPLFKETIENYPSEDQRVNITSDSFFFFYFLFIGNL